MSYNIGKIIDPKNNIVRKVVVVESGEESTVIGLTEQGELEILSVPGNTLYEESRSDDEMRAILRAYIQSKYKTFQERASRIRKIQLADRQQLQYMIHAIEN